MAPLAIYGATGYTGRMACHYAKSLNLNFVVAGRTEEKVKNIASLLNVSYSIFDVTQAGLIDSVFEKCFRFP